LRLISETCAKVEKKYEIWNPTFVSFYGAIGAGKKYLALNQRFSA